MRRFLAIPIVLCLLGVISTISAAWIENIINDYNTRAILLTRVNPGAVSFGATTGSEHAVFRELGGPVRCGWPMSSMSYQPRYAPPGDAPACSFDSGIHAKELSQLLGLPALHLPLRPIWRGFLINVLFFTGALWLIGFGWRDARMLWRTSCGRCPW